MVVWIDKRFCLDWECGLRLKGNNWICFFFFLFDQRSHVGWNCAGLILTLLIPFFVTGLIVPGCLLGRAISCTCMWRGISSVLYTIERTGNAVLWPSWHVFGRSVFFFFVITAAITSLML